MKVCSKCRLDKLDSDFARRKSSKDGLQDWCRFCMSSNQKIAYRLNPAKHIARATAYRKSNPECNKRNCLLYHRRKRMKVLQHYSKNEVPFCFCCKEDRLEFLCLDHINGGGGKHRKELKGSTAVYYWLVKMNFPKGYQVLCYNCNNSFGHYGYCPHNPKVKRTVIPHRKITQA